MSSAEPRVLVTGANGLLGSHLCRGLRTAGYRTLALSRRPVGASDGEWLHYDMAAGVPQEAFSGPVAAALHCAYETRPLDPRRAYRANVEGSRLLFEACRSHAVGKIVFISSLSAHPDAESAYGRSKLVVEELLDPDRDLAIRPGLILAPGGAGLYGRISSVIRRSRVIPLFYGGRQLIQTIAIEDLVEGIIRALRLDLTGTLRLAAPEPVLLRELYQEIARAAGVRPVFVPVPGLPALAILRAFETLGVRLPVSSENLLGLRQLRAFELRPDLERVGLIPRPMSEAIRTAS